ncbi:39S ribosomal protein L10, mitochondrial-like [Crotalus tigris]|uniref:39S ribosomal protein L10, mitochondrial-like n=1 Tax=Crotalus tigris TaxID=88082 RepID=UPI00192F9D2B|nr:39S ribosomal protein L10, mitochondrial-like [Crotalus tigris]XP_039207947.1 39S ribosomal protein L10, mitochondrial-like [Crotalus tigris]XP_039207948.1 39S ribosomal protein L10, mitochondrial-like [Crotalus tigris]XP_039207949.1 39S ribosomal protein L10, mitochondrial-like [Crotalus tigris]XP_039207950.1 39S ribosomal protein L10, mitochondrial-like [Crotalus tigris]XP_039207951.1 39S ribosomal protein L10, mitochondrial-like [Crotalus tigris]XP_039207952.1 39S ribosomal protein L10,
MAALSGWGKRVYKTGWLPTLQLIRHGAKSVTPHWKPMHIVKEKLMAVTEYIPPKPLTSETCMKPPVILPKEETNYERLLLHQVKQIFLESKMIVVCQYNYIPGNDMVTLRHWLRKYNVHVRFFPNKIMNPFLLESKYKNLLPLFVERNLLLVSMETRAQETLQILKRVPQINMLGACIDNVILSKQGFVNFAKLPSIVTAQGETAGLFLVMTSHSGRLLQRGSVHLCSLLDHYVQ